MRSYQDLSSAFEISFEYVLYKLTLYLLTNIATVAVLMHSRPVLDFCMNSTITISVSSLLMCWHFMHDAMIM